MHTKLFIDYSLNFPYTRNWQSATIWSQFQIDTKTFEATRGGEMKPKSMNSSSEQFIGAYKFLL